jgi:hypothetical protein
MRERERGVFGAIEIGQSFCFFSFDLYPMNPQAGNMDWTLLPPHPFRVVPAIMVIAHVVESSGGLQTVKKLWCLEVLALVMQDMILT